MPQARYGLGRTLTNKLVLLGAIAGTKRTEKKVHELVFRHCAPKPDEPFTRPLCVQGEWFDDGILPFVTELMKSPQAFLEANKKSPDRPARKDPSLHHGKIVLVFDSGETFNESFTLKVASPALALGALANIANARLSFLAHTVRITQLSVPGCPTRKVNLQGTFATQNCDPREGLSVIFNSEPDNCCATVNGFKQYSYRWFHGVPSDLYHDDNPWRTRPTSHFSALLNQFAQALNRTVLSAIFQAPNRRRRNFGAASAQAPGSLAGPQAEASAAPTLSEHRAQTIGPAADRQANSAAMGVAAERPQFPGFGPSQRSFGAGPLVFHGKYRTETSASSSHKLR